MIVDFKNSWDYFDKNFLNFIKFFLSDFLRFTKISFIILLNILETNFEN